MKIQDTSIERGHLRIIVYILADDLVEVVLENGKTSRHTANCPNDVGQIKRIMTALIAEL